MHRKNEAGRKASQEKNDQVKLQAKKKGVQDKTDGGGETSKGGEGPQPSVLG